MQGISVDTNEYLNLIVDLWSFHGVEEKALLESSYADYLEGCDSVVIKGAYS